MKKEDLYSSKIISLNLFTFKEALIALDNNKKLTIRILTNLRNSGFITKEVINIKF